MTTSDPSMASEPKVIQHEPETIQDKPEASAPDKPELSKPAGPEASKPERPSPWDPAGDLLANSVAAMSDAELRELASAVLAELRVRANDPTSRGFSYQTLVADLRRRLADAHAYAQSGFGQGDRRMARPATLPRDEPAAQLKALPPPASLSEEKKAMLLTGFEAELLADQASPHAGATGYLPEGWDTADVPIEDSEGLEPVDVPQSAASIEDEIWEALQLEVARSTGLPPTTGDDTPGR